MSNKVCYFCGGHTSYGTYTADYVKDGPDAKPTHPTCVRCKEEKRFARRGRCSNCGKLRPLLYTENDSMTTTWVSYRIGSNTNTVLCPDCQGLIAEDRERTVLGDNFPSRIPLTETEIELLRKWHKMPGWKKATRMPPLIRDIDDEWEYGGKICE